MIFTKEQQDYITEAMKASMHEMKARGMESEMQYVIDRLHAGDKLVDKPKQYLEHLLNTLEYIQEVLND